MNRAPLGLALGLAALAACADQDGTDVGNPVSATFSLAPDGRAVVDRAGAVFEIQRAELRVVDLSYTLPEGVGCADLLHDLQGNLQCEGDQLSLPGNLTFDLLTGEAGRPLVVPDLAYPEVRFQIRGHGNEPGLRVWAEDADGHRIDVRLGGTEPVVLVSDDPAVAFDARVWFGEVDLLGCVVGGTLPDDGGAAVVEDDAGAEGPCASLAAGLAERVVGSAR